MSNIFVNDYNSILDVHETQLAIKLVKDTFESILAKNLDLTRVSAPLFVEPKTGLNDDLSGYEKAVSFTAVSSNTKLEIVQSLAKWKRHALHKYNCTGIYTDMNAIRPFEDQDNIHSLYVDQWDWEKIITKEDRNESFLRDIVGKIYKALLETCNIVTKQFPNLTYDLPENITFITTDELESLYPNLSRKERENEITKKYKAVFLSKIGYPLKDNKPHDSRSADYDDWNLNGDILLWYEPLNIAFEISSMGIRVDKEQLLKQLEYKNELHKLEYTYHQNIINDVLPLTVGGGIGQSRICMFFLKKVHIGEVQASYWKTDDIEEFKKYNIHLL